MFILFLFNLALMSGVLYLLMFRSTSWKSYAIGWVYFLIGALLLCVWWISDSFTGQGVTESTWFHLENGTNGVPSGVLMAPSLLLAGWAGVMASCLVAGGWMLYRRLQKGSVAPSNRIIGGLLVFGFLSNPTLVQSAELAWISKHRVEYASELLDEVKTVKTDEGSVGKVRPNVLMIYAEGLERDFLDDAKFPGLMPNLNRLRSSAFDFKGIREVSFTSWTIAGQIASQCAMPMGKQSNGVNVPEGAPRCFGGELSLLGYSQRYINGSNLDFAGKGAFWSANGYQVAGRDEVASLAQKDAIPYSQWGAYDDDLLDAVRLEYQRLSSLRQPFALSVLTLDTHAIEGHETPSCQKDKPYSAKHPMLNAVHCADKLLGDFLGEVLSEDPHTIVVLMSDHLQPLTVKIPGLDRRKSNRENLLLVWTPERRGRLVEKEASAFDVYPTIVDAMGWDMPAAGLGRSLLREDPTLVEKMGLRKFSRGLYAVYLM